VDWHARFTQQAHWTHDLRQHLYQQIDLRHCMRVLEVGCGTGALLAELPAYTPAHNIGVDLSMAHLAQAQTFSPVELVQGDGLRLPFSPGIADAALCHFYLLWVSDPLQALREMLRVTRPGGWVAALAEPDYGGRIDHPASLAELGALQGESLRLQGADPCMGRKLTGLFHQAGLVNVQGGLLGGQWNDPPGADAWEMEWRVLENDLQGMISTERLHELRNIDAAAWAHGERILFVPTFFAVGQVARD
jgi:SAM-dependent methyltransferase